MSQRQLSIRIVLFLLISSAATLMFIFDGCKRQKEDKRKFIFDHAVSSLTDTVNTHKSSDFAKRAKVALSKLKNGVLDTKPIILHASLEWIEPNDDPGLFLTYFDEDSDLRGLRIKEQYVDPNGMTKILEEDYPLFVNALDGLIWESARFPVQFRDKNQRKDKLLWLECVNKNLDGLIRKYIDKKQQDDPASFVRKVTWKEEDMPPVYVSVPDPNVLNVFISIYDRSGNESERVELLAIPHIRPSYLPQKKLHRQE